MLEGPSGRLATYHQLPAVVQGALITAVGSSFPELSGTVLATLLHGTFDLWVVSVVGSALFNILIISDESGLVGGAWSRGAFSCSKTCRFTSRRWPYRCSPSLSRPSTPRFRIRIAWDS